MLTESYIHNSSWFGSVIIHCARLNWNPGCSWGWLWTLSSTFHVLELIALYHCAQHRPSFWPILTHNSWLFKGKQKFTLILIPHVSLKNRKLRATLIVTRALLFDDDRKVFSTRKALRPAQKKHLQCVTWVWHSGHSFQQPLCLFL